MIRDPDTGKYVDPTDRVPSRLTSRCECGTVIGYGIDHLCDFTPREPGDRACSDCGRYVNCTCPDPRITERDICPIVGEN